MADNKDKKVRNVPALRFPEFTDEWKEVLFASNLERLENGANYNTNDKDGVPMSRIETISTGRIDYTKVGHCSTPQKIEHYIMRYGDILFSHINSLKHIGKTAYYSAEEPLYHGMNLLLFRCKNNVDSKFFFFLINNTHFIRKCQILAKQAVNQASISTSDLKKIKVYIPDINEQSKIQKFLSLIEKRIELQNKIIEKLETLIKGITDVLLDNPLWEKVFLHSFMQFYQSNSLSWEQLSYEDGKIRNLHYGLIHNFSTKGINANSLPMILSHNEPKQYTLCKVGDVAFADASEDTNEIGKAVEFISVHPSGTICGLHTLHGRDIKNKTVVGFKGFAFNSRYFHNQIKRLAQGSKVFSITANNLLSCYIYIPNIAKQEMITKLLHAYEEKIMANKTLLDKYEMQRTYLLQRMFI